MIDQSLFVRKFGAALLCASPMVACSSAASEALPSVSRGDSAGTDLSSTGTPDAPADPLDSGSTSRTPAPGSTSASESPDSATSTSGEATGTGPTLGAGAWTLVWVDEFDGDSIDPSRWEHEQNCWGGGNDEQQCYTDSPTNSFVDDGVLHIVAIHEPTTGPAVNDDDPNYDPNDVSASQPFSSARLRTRNKAEWRYGRVEVRARMPFGQGTWPAAWMLPTDQVYGPWAASGEIDIVEAVNLGHENENRIHGTIHYGGSWPLNTQNTSSTQLPGGARPQDDFHTYAIEWEDGEIRWYVDGVRYHEQRDEVWYTPDLENPAEGSAPFDQRFHLLVNLAVGGRWPGEADPAVFPQELLIDHIRVYECSTDPVTGRGCESP